MVHAGLTPTDPVRWFMAYTIEMDQQDGGGGQVTPPTGPGGPGPDIEVMGDGG